LGLNIMVLTIIIHALMLSLPHKPIFLGKARSLLLEWSPVRTSNWAGSRLGCKYQTKAKMIKAAKHTTLLKYIINYSHKFF
jgi:hypothetical protein